MAKQFIKATMSTDLKSYHAFACCNHLTKPNLNEMGFTNRRIDGHLHDQLIKETKTWNNSKKSFDVIYTPTKSGAKFMSEKIDMKTKDFYTSQSAFHDSGLYQVYSQCEYKDTWKTENQLRDHLEEEHDRLRTEGEWDRLLELERLQEEHKISPCDGAYSIDGEMYCVEICTENYTEQDKENKANFAEALNAHKEFYNI